MRRLFGNVAARRALLGVGLAAAVAASQVLPAAAAAASVTSTPSSAASTNLIQQLTQLQSQINALTQGSLSSAQTVAGAVYGSTAQPPQAPHMNYPTAPADFRAYLTSLVSALGAVVQQIPMAEGPQTQAALSEYGAALAGLSQSTLNQVYFYMSQGSHWQQYPAILQSAVAEITNKAPNLSTQFNAWVTANAPQYGPLVGSASGSTGSPGGSPVTVTSPGSGSAPLSPSLTTGPSTAAATTASSDAFPPLPADTCPPIIPYPGMVLLLHGLDLVETGLDKGAKLAERDDTDGAIVLGEGVVITIPGIVHDILEVAAFVVQAANLAATILDELYTECETEAHQELLRTLYENLSRTQGQVIANTVTIISDVTALTTIVNARTATILQNIAYLRQQIQSQVATILNSQSALINVVNNQTLQNLQNQQTATASRNLQLQIQVENSLSAPLQQNDALFELPASVGGYLDATPVGVQAVVSQLLVSMQQAGESIAPQALLALSLADRALSMQKYKLAYVLFKITYQILQYVGPLGPPFGAHFGVPVGPDSSPPFGSVSLPPGQSTSTSSSGS